MPHNKSLFASTLLVLLPAMFSACTEKRPDAAAIEKEPPLYLQVAAKDMHWNEPETPAKIIGPIYSVGTKGLNAYLITTSEGLILINTAMPSSAKLIDASIRQLGFRPEDIKWILANDAHIDHVGAHAYFKKLAGAQVAMMGPDVPTLESGGKSDFLYGPFKQYGFAPVKVDRILYDQDVIRFGGLAITALLTPGHTKGSTTFVMEVIDNGRTYNVVFPADTDILPGYHLVREPSYPSIYNDFLWTFDVLDSLKPDVWLKARNEASRLPPEALNLVPKRDLAATNGPTAWVDPEGYRAWVAGQRAKFDAEVKKQLAQPTP